MAESAKPGPPAVEQGWWLAGREDVAEGDAVVARFTAETRGSGRTISYRGLTFYRLVGGKIVEDDSVTTPDLAQELDGLGRVPVTPVFREHAIADVHLAVAEPVVVRIVVVASSPSEHTRILPGAIQITLLRAADNAREGSIRAAPNGGLARGYQEFPHH